MWIYDTSRAFRLSHLPPGSSTDFNASQNCIVRSAKMRVDAFPRRSGDGVPDQVDHLVVAVDDQAL